MSYLVDNLQRLVSLRGTEAEVEALDAGASLEEVVVAWATDTASLGIRTNGSWEWIPQAAVSALDDLSDVTITAAAAGHILRYSGSAWVNTLLVVSDYPYHAEPLCDSSGPILTATGDVIMVVGVPN